MALVSSSVALLALIVATCAAAEPTSEDLKADRAALTQWIARENHCDGQRDSVSINRLLYFDFNADGVPELVVTASSCNTGNAGPDIHAVYAKNSKGGFTEIAVPEVEPKYYEAMIGNRNYTLTVEDGQLIAEWHDGSDRPLAPLKIRYMWANGGFRVVAINAPYTKP